MRNYTDYRPACLAQALWGRGHQRTAVTHKPRERGEPVCAPASHTLGKDTLTLITFPKIQREVQTRSSVVWRQGRGRTRSPHGGADPEVRALGVDSIVTARSGSGA